MKSSEVREQMANALTLDLVGPVSGLAAGAHWEREILLGRRTKRDCLGFGCSR